jgi:hypothetical protein
VYELLDSILYPLTRWVHIVCSTLIAGGTLFFELVLPIALEDLSREQRFYALARARLVFRWVVWLSVAGLMLSGGVTLHRMWDTYFTDEFRDVVRWAIAHIVGGTLAMIIALVLTIGRRPPENPLGWMRVNLVILFIVIFLGSATRYFQVALTEHDKAPGRVPPATSQP